MFETQKDVAAGISVFSEFLKLHPFVSGNGRVARLLVNFLLSRVSVVPISIFLDDSFQSYEKNSFRKTYLNLVGQAQWHDNQEGLATMFLLSAKRAVLQAEYLMLSDNDEVGDVAAPSSGCHIL